MEIKYSTPVITIKPELSIFDALLEMQTKFVKHIVVAVKNIPVGIVTERDINRFLGEDKTAHAINEIPIKHVMQKNVISITDGMEDHFVQCAARMETFKIGSVVLVNDNGEIIGIVSRTDLTKSYASVFGGRYSVKQFMNKKIVTCRKNDSLKFVSSLMNKNQVSRVIVTDENGNPVGLISTNTLLIHSDYFTNGKTRSRDYLLPVNKEKMIVEDLLTDELVTVNEEDDLAIAASKMIKNQIGGIPVINSNHNLVGIVSKTDVVRAFSIVGQHEEIKSKYKELY
ncbi:CBS domain-containing protein [Candidatus Nitrosarchaeum limnium]|jgi:CBS domain-containing protein|uniref:CBS domain protein n=1 Tax=Candidatus Nitrosarchaeum limnium BG20 TaxID=859192 RepID=S2E6L8_9ARCH|nr:CBS domain-containing protein [Candidatus Nitrosarchaeum limnium]EPA06835.1 CBS domain protein [Candidatus Nitrosarchaeum limnium BG20]